MQPSRSPAPTPAPTPDQTPDQTRALTPAQHEIWLAQQQQQQQAAGPRAVACIIGETLHFDRPLDPGRLAAAVDAAIAATATLHTRFVLRDGVPRQVRIPPAPGAMRHVRLADAAARAQWIDADLAQAAAGFRERPFGFALLELADGSQCLLQRFHHLVTDGAGVAEIARRIAAAYGAPPDGPAAGDDGEALDAVLDAACAYAGSAAQAEDMRFWRDALGSAPEVSRFEASRFEPSHLAAPDRTADPASADRPHLTLTLAPAQGLTDRLAAVSAAHGVAVTALLTAAMAALVQRRTDRDTVLLGQAWRGLRPAGLRQVPALTATRLPLRLDLDPEETLFWLASRIAGHARRALRHTRASGEAVARQCLPGGGTFGPLVNVMAFDYRMRFGTIGFVARNLSIGPVDDVALCVYLRDQGEGRGGLGLELAANPALHDAAALAGLGAELLRLLDDAAMTPDRHLRDLAPLDGGEQTRADMLGRSAAQVPIATWPALLAASLARSLARDPQATAIVAAEDTLSHHEMSVRANRLARLLVARGVGPGAVVALALPRGVAMVLAMVATGQAGGAFLPLDTTQPPARLAAILAQARPALVLTDTATLPMLPEAATLPVLPKAAVTLALDVAAVQAEWMAADDRPLGDADRLAPLTPDHPAYVIFTSGTTGVPKGAVLAHRGLAPLLDSLHRQAGLGPGSRVLQFSAPSFDVMVAEVMMALDAGATLVVAPPASRHGAALARLLREAAITHAVIPPAALSALDPGEVGALPVLMVGGEAIPPALVARWAPGRTLINVYGPTETTFCVTLSAPMRPGAPVVLGRPIAGVALSVRNRWGRLVPPGRAGELHVRGPGVGLGYLNAPELEAGRFDGPAAPGAWPGYRTGDRVAWDASGELVFLGRLDDQVKLRGFRIEPDEVARLLERQPGVREARVLLRADPASGRARLLGYVLATTDGADAAGGCGADVTALRRALAVRLPDYMVPAAITVVAAWPLTAHGKLDRAALPEPAFETGEAVAPRTPLEMRLADMMAQSLGLSRVGVTDSFFDLGGDSLLGTGLGLRIAAELGHEIGLADLFAAPSVAALAEHLQTRTGTLRFDQVSLALRAGGRLPPLICVHPAPGLGLAYGTLLRHLSLDRPVHTLQARSFADPDAAPADFAAMVADYLGLVRALQPHGPYHLLGWSSGAAVAHALAVSLQAQGEAVPLLVALDGYPAGPHYRELLGLDLDPAVLREGTRLLVETYLETGLRRHLADRQVVDAGMVDAMLRVQSETLALLLDARSGRYVGDLLLFTCAVPQLGVTVPPPEIWAPHVSGALTVVEVPDEHTSMLLPRSAAIIGARLDAALRDGASGMSA